MKDQTIKKQTDAYLVTIKNGDISALENLYDLTHRLLFSLCYSYFQNQSDSEDALHDSYLTAIKNISKYTGSNGFNWLFTITKNTCLNILKKQGRMLPTDLDSLEVKAPPEPPVFDESGIFALSEKALNENEFRIVILHTIHQMKFGDIAKGLGKLETTVRWQYNNAIKKIKLEYERRQGL